MEANSLAEALETDGDIYSACLAGTQSKDSAIGFVMDSEEEYYDEE